MKAVQRHVAVLQAYLCSSTLPHLQGLGQGKKLMVGAVGEAAAGHGSAGPSGTHTPNVRHSSIVIAPGLPPLVPQNPLEINSRIECKWRDGQYHLARIIERRQNPDTQEWEYYVHYNKRT